jgi:hypothetical protein
MIVWGPMRIQLGMNPLYRPRSPSARTVCQSPTTKKVPSCVVRVCRRCVCVCVCVLCVCVKQCDSQMQHSFDLRRGTNLDETVGRGLVEGRSAFDHRLIHDPRLDHIHLPPQ